jgi:hypothetical protein
MAMDAADAIRDKSVAILMFTLLNVLHRESASTVIAMRDVLERAVKDATDNKAGADELAIVTQAWALVNAITLTGGRET